MTSFGGDIYTAKVAQSTSIDFNNGIVTSATLTAIVTEGNFAYYLSANGGTDWELVENGVSHTFTNTGNDLKWKIEGSGRISNIQITITH